MPTNFSEILVVGVSSRALFDLEIENKVFATKGIKGFREYQLEHENEPLNPGTAFPLIQSLLQLNNQASKQIIEVVASKGSLQYGFSIE